MSRGCESERPRALAEASQALFYEGVARAGMPAVEVSLGARGVERSYEKRTDGSGVRSASGNTLAEFMILP